MIPGTEKSKSSSKAYKAREAVKTEILRQRIASAFDSKKLESKFLGQQKFIWMMTWWMFQKKKGTPKSSILRGFSIIDHQFCGTTIFGNTLVVSNTFT